MIRQIKTNSTFRSQSKPKHISNSKQVMTVQSSQAHFDSIQLHVVPNALHNRAEHLLSKLRKKEIGIVEALQELEPLSLPKQLYLQILREAQIIFQALPDDQQEKVLNNPVSESLKKLPSHPIFAGNHFNLAK